MSSRIVEIKRVTFGRIEAAYPDFKSNIGATMTKSGEVATGLSNEELKKYMPAIINAEPSDVNFRTKVDSYFKSLTLRSTKGNSIMLEIGTTEDGEFINPLNLIHYRFALQNPKVASHPSKMKPGYTKFVVYDKEEELRKNIVELDKRRDAYKEFIKLIDDDKKYRVVTTVLADRIGYSVVGIHKADQREVKLALEKFVQDKPIEFYSVVTDKKLEVKAFIEACVSAGVLNRVGTALLNGDSKIGNTVDEAVIFLTDKANSEVYVTLKARVEELKKAM